MSRAHSASPSLYFFALFGTDLRYQRLKPLGLGRSASSLVWVTKWDKGGEGERDLKLFAAFSLATLAEHEARAVREEEEAVAAGAAAAAAAAEAAAEESAASNARGQAEAEREAAEARERAAAAALARLEEKMRAAAAAGARDAEEGEGASAKELDAGREGAGSSLPTLSESDLAEAAARRRAAAESLGLPFITEVCER